jgi:hypothetical protein
MPNKINCLIFRDRSRVFTFEPPLLERELPDRLLLASDIRVQRCGILAKVGRLPTKKMWRLFLAARAKGHKQGDKEAKSVDRNVPKMLTDKHRPKRKRIHGELAKFAQVVDAARYRAQLIPVGIPKPLLIIVFDVVIGRQLGNVVFVWRLSHGFGPMLFHCIGRQFTLLGIEEHVIEEGVYEHPSRGLGLVESVQIHFEGNVSAPGTVHLLLNHTTIVAQFGEQSAGKKRVHTTGTGSGEEGLKVIVGVLEIVVKEIGAGFGEGPHGGEGIFHQAHFALGIGLRDDFGDYAVEQFFGPHKIPDFHEQQCGKQHGE